MGVTEYVEDVRFFAVAAFYVMCNFMPALMAAAVYLMVTGSWYGYVLLVLFSLDYALPLKMPDLSPTWCQMTDEVEGKMRCV